MFAWWRKHDESLSAEQTIRLKYTSFRELLSLNNECLELIAGIQEDLQYAPPSRRVLGDRVNTVFLKVQNVVATLEHLVGDHFPSLGATVHSQQHEVETYISARDELDNPPLAFWLSEIDHHLESEVGSKAAALGEIKNKLPLPVPDGYVLTAEAYRQFCGVPLWTQIRDAARNVDLNNLDRLQQISCELAKSIKECPVPRAVEIALMERAHTLSASGAGLAVRSSAVGEGGERTFAGQFLSLLNVPPDGIVDAYREVVAGRFSDKALFYRLSAGLPEVESPMAVLCLKLISAQAAGIMYTRDPNDPKSESLWITATRGLGLDIASGLAPADLFVLSRKGPHAVLEQNVVQKDEQIIVGEPGRLSRQTLSRELAAGPSLKRDHLVQLAEWALQIEHHFGCPQDVEWVLDQDDKLWVVQSRPLTLAGSGKGRSSRTRVRGEPILSGGRSVYPGRVSGPAHRVTDSRALGATPQGAILFLRKAYPEIIEVFPRISGLVTEWGNLTGHAAALLREFKIPSVFQLPGAFDAVHDGDPLSLDAVQPRVYRGNFWPSRNFDTPLFDRYRDGSDPINSRLLTLHLLDPSAFNFRPSGCRSAHDVLRFCHEKAIEAMFALNDREIEHGSECAKKLLTPAPINLHVLDLGGGLLLEDRASEEVKPLEIVSRPFQALWRGVTHPGVTWTRGMRASFSDVASVVTTSLASSTSAIRALGEKSYLLVAHDYMNLNSRLAYHFTLVDACVSDVPGNNYIAFRFAGGGAARQRRNLRACFIEACLSHYGFVVDRRGDLVNAWFKKLPAEETEFHLDILGRLMACTSQLDMYMTSNTVMQWYVKQFLEGNYSLQPQEQDSEQREVSVS